jgi:tripartite-type tricarboxylate transporter receptor subunit TctC
MGVRSYRSHRIRATDRHLDYGSPGVGTLGHFITERFAREAAFRYGIQTVAARPQCGSRGRHRRVGVNRLGSALGQIRGGKYSIAVSSNTVAEAPQVPTLKGLAIKPRHLDLVWSLWTGQDAARRRREDQSRRVEVLRRPAVRERFNATRSRPTMSPEEYTAYMASELQSWGPLAKQLAPQN